MRTHVDRAQGTQCTARKRPAENARAVDGRADTRVLPRPLRLPAFANLQEALLENMIQNILVEASRGEVVLTSRPRVIALPPLSVSRWGRRLCRRGARGGRGGQAWPEGSLQPLSGAFCLPGLRLPTCFRRRPSGCRMPKCPAWRCRPLPTLRGCHGPAPPTCCPQGPPLHSPATKASSLLCLPPLYFPDAGGILERALGGTDGWSGRGGLQRLVAALGAGRLLFSTPRRRRATVPAARGRAPDRVCPVEGASGGA